MTRKEELTRSGWWTLLAGFIGALLAVASGLLAESDLSLAGPPLDVLESHKQAAFASVVCFGLVLFWRVAARRAIPVNRRIVFWLFYAAGVALIWVVAWYGGELVYSHGIR